MRKIVNTQSIAALYYCLRVLQRVVHATLSDSHKRHLTSGQNCLALVKRSSLTAVLLCDTNTLVPLGTVIPPTTTSLRAVHPRADSVKCSLMLSLITASA
eukprot:3880-Heterococcus_DN1.PRE.2